MARLIAIPVRDKGDAILIVSNCDDVIMMGFVTQSVLAGFFDHPPAMDECMAFVDLHLVTFETVLSLKSAACFEPSIACVEIDAADLARSGLAEWRPS